MINRLVAHPGREEVFRTRVSAVVLAATTSAGLLAFPTVAAHAAGSTSGPAAQSGIGIRLLDASVTRRNDPRAHIYIDDFVHPGATLTRHVEVSDFTDKPVTLQMYAVASSINGTGWQVAANRTANELTSWIKVSPGSVALQPGKSAVVTVQIAVPSSASAGEQYATVVAELPPPPAAPGTTVRVASRVGVRVYLEVGDGGEPASNFTVSTLTATRAPDGTPTVTATVTNTGGRALDLGGTLNLANGPGGLRAGPFDVQIPATLGIGETGNVTVTLDKQTPAGPWLARMALRSGYVEHDVKGTITFPNKPGTSAAPVKAIAVPLTKNRHVLIPIAAGLILLLGIGLALWFMRRRRRDEDDDHRGGRGNPPSIPSQREADRSAVRAS